MIWTTMALAAQPWQVGAAPSASKVDKGVAISAHTAIGGPGKKGARVAAGFSPHKRIWGSVEVGAGAGWRSCIDCRSFGATGTLRLTALDFKPFKLAAWGLGSMGINSKDALAGVAAEVIAGPVRLEASMPLVGTYDRETVLDTFPELGLRVHWSKRNATRIAMVGLAPSFALTHRLDLGKFTLEGTAQYQEGGIRGEAGARFHF